MLFIMIREIKVSSGWWPIYVFNSVVNIKLPAILFHRCSTSWKLTSFIHLYLYQCLKLFSFFNIFLQLRVHTSSIHFKIMYYTFFHIQFIIKKFFFMDYIWDLTADKHVQWWVYRKVYGLNMHMGETVHFRGVIDRDSVTVAGRINWRLDNLIYNQGLTNGDRRRKYICF